MHRPNLPRHLPPPPPPRTTRAAASAPMMRVDRRAMRRFLSLAALSSGLLLLYISDSPASYAHPGRSRSLLRLSDLLPRRMCPYLTPEQSAILGETIPRPGERGRRLDAVKPSHVSLCEEYIARHTAGTDVDGGESGGSSWTGATAEIVEDPAVCGDWSSPHRSVLSLFASALVAAVGSDLGLKYRHSCQAVAPPPPDGLSEVQVTSAQQTLPEDLLHTEDISALESEEVLELCRRCVDEFRTSPFGTSAHQCLLIPDSELKEGEEAAPVLVQVLSSMTDHLHDAAYAHLNRTDVDFGDLHHESKSGAVVFLDDTSTFMNYSVYDRLIPHHIDHVCILASEACAVAAGRGESTCLDHGSRLMRYLLIQRRALGITVHLDVVGSTATSFAKMINTHRLVCPPGTVPCLIPALVKSPLTSTALAESSTNPVGRGWFDSVGRSAEGDEILNVLVLRISDEESDMPLWVIGEGGEEPPVSSETAAAASEAEPQPQPQPRAEAETENVEPMTEPEPEPEPVEPEPRPVEADTEPEAVEPQPEPIEPEPHPEPKPIEPETVDATSVSAVRSEPAAASVAALGAVSPASSAVAAAGKPEPIEPIEPQPQPHPEPVEAASVSAAVEPEASVAALRAVSPASSSALMAGTPEVYASEPEPQPQPQPQPQPKEPEKPKPETETEPQPQETERPEVMSEPVGSGGGGEDDGSWEAAAVPVAPAGASQTPVGASLMAAEPIGGAGAGGSNTAMIRNKYGGVMGLIKDGEGGGKKSP